ncbi:DUF5810 domain-containing protein [Halobacterium rubrum]|uniref:DUF5810 domain-containing protein n=1 Tax=Halobacterium TaxID=2239 RepID=UPI001F43E09C|nr:MULTISPECIES: DUF5810 domain-containing protein [Halobacterium]MDH5020479.1 DUF5810 domain-containing protein [Halobacterium rubrum]
MGYECPVCGVEEADGEHLANHVAFTALVRGGDHEAWLDEHVPDWAERDPDSLAPEVTEHATETDSEPATEPHDHDVPSFERAGGSAGGADLSGAAGDVLEEARELTEAMYDDAQRDDGDDSDGASGADSENE